MFNITNELERLNKAWDAVYHALSVTRDEYTKICLGTALEALNDALEQLQGIESN